MKSLLKKGIKVLSVDCDFGENLLQDLQESKSFTRRYAINGELCYRVITDQGYLLVALHEGFEFDGRSGTPLVDCFAPNLGSLHERYSWLTHDCNGYAFDLSFHDTNLLLEAMLRDLCKYSKTKASVIKYAVSLNKSWFGKPKKNDWCYKNINKIKVKWFPNVNI